MNHIRIDHEKCIGCSLCVNDCPSSHLYLEKGKANAQASGCIECGHCFAICPVYAVSIEGYPCVDEPVTPMTEFDSDRLLSAMKSRRTIRSFTAQPIEEEKLKSLLELPPGHEAVSCLVIGYPGVTYQRIPPRREQRVRKL